MESWSPRRRSLGLVSRGGQLNVFLDLVLTSALDTKLLWNAYSTTERDIPHKARIGDTVESRLSGLGGMPQAVLLATLTKIMAIPKQY